jgi:hypothetical protein
VIVTQAQIDAAVSERFPVSKKFLMIFEITYSNPQVTLLEDSNKIQVGLDAVLDIRIDGEPKKLGGGCTIISGIQYDPDIQAFFLDDAEFERFEIQGAPNAYLDRVTGFASEFAREFVESKPIYRLKAKDARTAATKLLLKDVEVRDQSVRVYLGM